MLAMAHCLAIDLEKGIEAGSEVVQQSQKSALDTLAKLAEAEIRATTPDISFMCRSTVLTELHMCR